MSYLETARTHWFPGQHGDELKPLNASSTVLSNAIRVKSGAGLLYGFTVTNTKASAQYILLFDRQGTLPGAGAIPDAVFVASASLSLGVAWLPPRACRQGIILCNSSTADTLTAGSADCWFDVQYI